MEVVQQDPEDVLQQDAREALQPFYDCDPEAFTQVAIALYPRLVRYFLRHRCGLEDAHDLAQTTLVKIFLTKENAAARPAPDRRLIAWALVIGHNLWVDWLRREVGRPVAVLSDRAHATDDFIGLAVNAMALHHCLEQLTPPQFEFVSLWEDGLGELTQREIAVYWAVGDAAVSRLKGRVLTRLAHCLRPGG